MSDSVVMAAQRGNAKTARAVKRVLREGRLHTVCDEASCLRSSYHADQQAHAAGV
jgi:lipoate synthase